MPFIVINLLNDVNCVVVVVHFGFFFFFSPLARSFCVATLSLDPILLRSVSLVYFITLRERNHARTKNRQQFLLFPFSFLWLYCISLLLCFPRFSSFSFFSCIQLYVPSDILFSLVWIFLVLDRVPYRIHACSSRYFNSSSTSLMGTQRHWMCAILLVADSFELRTFWDGGRWIGWTA
jgi:hypothetical protein